MKIISGFIVFCFLIGTLCAQDQDRFWLDAQINDKPARLIFDTGSEDSGLFPNAVKRLGLGIATPVPDTSKDVGRVGAGETEVAQLKIAGTTVMTSFKIWPGDLSSYDFPQDGMIGWPSVSGNILLIEAATHTLKSVGKVAEAATDWGKFRFLTNHDVLTLEIPGREGENLVVDIDTGKPAGVTLNPERWREWMTANPHRPATLNAYTMLGAGNQIKEESWADTITLGALTITDVPVMEANISEVTVGASNYTATLGMAALKRMDLIVDGKNNFAYVRLRQTPPIEYAHNRLGAVFAQTETGSTELIAHVAAHSPATDAGIRDGDVLLKVDEHDVAGLLTDHFLVPLVLEWHRPAGTRFDLTLQRGSDIYKTTVVLRNILEPQKISSVPSKALASEAKWLTELGDVAYRENHYDQAINNYNEVIRIKPDEADAFNGRGAVYYFKGGNDLALADFNEAIRLNPKLASAFNNRGTLRANAQHDEAGAIVDYTEAIRLDSTDFDSYHNRGISLGLMGDYDKAIVDFNQALELKPDSTRALLDRGLGYEKKGQYDKAFSDYSEAARLKPDLAEAFKLRGALQLAANNFKGGIEDLNISIRLNPTDFLPLHDRGLAYWRTGAFDLAIADLTEALRLKPGNAITLFVRGAAYAGKGENEKAITDLSEAIKLDPKNLEAYSKRAGAYYAIHDFTRAIADFNELARAVPDNAKIYMNRGLAYYQEEKYDEAISDFTETFRRDTNQVQAVVYRAYSYRKKNDYARAIADYESLLHRGPENPGLLNGLAELLAVCPDDTLRDGKRAVKYARKACKLTSWKDANALDTLAEACAADGNFFDAVKWEEACLRLNVPDTVRPAVQKRLELFQENKPYRETTP